MQRQCHLGCRRARSRPCLPSPCSPLHPLLAERATEHKRGVPGAIRQLGIALRNYAYVQQAGRVCEAAFKVETPILAEVVTRRLVDSHTHGALGGGERESRLEEEEAVGELDAPAPPPLRSNRIGDSFLFEGPAPLLE